MRRLLFALLLLPLPALAQPLSPLSPEANARMPTCGPALDGQVMCRFGLVYECQYNSPASMERRTGWRWQSDLLRGCDTAPAPADLPEYGRTALPPGFAYAPQLGATGLQSSSGAQSTQPRVRR